MKRTILWKLAVVCVFGFSCAVPAAQAQFKLAAQQISAGGYHHHSGRSIRVFGQQLA